MTSLVRASPLVSTGCIAFVLLLMFVSLGARGGASDEEFLPSPPTGLRTLLIDVHPVLTWDMPDDSEGASVTGFRVYWSEGDRREVLFWRRIGGRPGPLHNATVTHRFFVHEEALAGRVYSYSVAAINRFGEGETSRWYATVPLVNLPSGPLNLTVARERGRVSLEWERPADDGGAQIVSYLVYRGTGSDHLELVTIIQGDRFSYLTRSEPPTQLVDNGALGPVTTSSDVLYHGTTRAKADEWERTRLLDDNTTYFYMVQARNTRGLGHLSDPVAAASLGRPCPPRNVILVNGPGEAFLSWDPPDDPTFVGIQGYVVTRRSDGNAPQVIAWLGPGTTSYTDPWLDSEADYGYTVRARNLAGLSEPSPEVGIVQRGPASGTRTDPVEPGAPVPIVALLCILVACVVAALLVLRDRLM